MTAIAPRTGLRFARVVHAEWTKLRTARSLVATVMVASVVLVLFSWLTASGSHAGVCTGAGQGGTPSCHGEPPLPLGPGGEAVADTFFFVHQPLVGDVSVTVRVTSLSSVISTAGGRVEVGTDLLGAARPGVVPWAKAGLLVTPSLNEGSSYAAVMATGSHGVRMQSNYSSDTAGAAGAVSAGSPRWLRLTRSGDRVTGLDSVDGVHWATIGTAQLHNAPATVEVGLFVASPFAAGSSVGGEATYSTATFDQLDLNGSPPGSKWTVSNVGSGPGYPGLAPGRYEVTGDVHTVGGSGDIAPALRGDGGAGAVATLGLVGAFPALIVVSALGALFMTTEYRRKLIRSTFAATPERAWVLAAKAAVVGVATFVPAVVGSWVALLVSRHLLRGNGNALFPLSGATEVRVILGTAAVLALTAVLALAVAAMLRRSSGTVVAVVAMTVLPYILALSLSRGVGVWLMRLTPAAGFAVQQSVPRYHQVASAYTVLNGYYPLSPLGGITVMCAWTLLALGGATVLLRRRDA
jgi:hypothetical protein